MVLQGSLCKTSTMSLSYVGALAIAMGHVWHLEDVASRTEYERGCSPPKVQSTCMTCPSQSVSASRPLVASSVAK